MRTRRDLTWHGWDEMVLPAKLAAVLKGVGKETESMIRWNTTSLLQVYEDGEDLWGSDIEKPSGSVKWVPK
jgi:hypothetical protein